MRNKMNEAILIFLILMFFLLIHTFGFAFENITAKEAFEMVCKGDAMLIDIRTIEEAVFVGVPACEPSGKQLSYLIPFNIWDGSIPVIEPKKLPVNPDFQKIIEKTFPDKDKTLITMCREGNRCDIAVFEIKKLGYKKVYQIDSENGGCGGFSGSIYFGEYAGHEASPCDKTEKVSWREMGLPTTLDLDPEKIPKLEK
jgi:rhodanese-related sulfurtransferase